MKKPSHLAHVVFRTSQYQEMIDWYKKVLSAEITYSNDMVAFVTFDKEHHRVAFINNPDVKEPVKNSKGVDHVAFTYHSLKDLLDNYSELKEIGIEPFWCINHGPTTSMYYRDPDSNQVELQVENFDTVEESTKFFYSQEFSENPIGVEFDPDDLKVKLAAGVSEVELKARPKIGARGLQDGVPLE